MKKVLLIFVATLFIVSPFAARSQMTVTLNELGTNDQFTGAKICSGDASSNPEMLLTASNFDPSIGTNSSVRLVLVVKDFEQNITRTTLNDATVFSTSSTISWKLELGNNTVESFITPNVGGTGSDPFNRIEGIYYFEISWLDNNNQFHQRLSSDFIITEADPPRIRITDANEAIANWTGYETRFSILSGCVSNDPRIRLYPFQCGTDAIELWVEEWDPVTSSAIGARVQRLLTSAEIATMQNTTGFSIDGYTDGVNTVSLSTGKHYRVSMIYVGQGQWKATFALMSYKSGTWDLMIKDNPSDNGTEPTVDFDVFNSPDIWNRLYTGPTTPNSANHEPPQHVTVAGNSNRLMVNVTNIGCSTSSANVPLRLFWTRARTDELWETHWLYDMTNNSVPDAVNSSIMRPAGSEITISGATMSSPYNTSTDAYLLPPINANTTFSIPLKSSGGNAGGVDWFPPDPAWYDASNGAITTVNGDEKPVLCLLARINEHNSPNDPIVNEPTSPDEIEMMTYAKWNNNVATLNSYLVVDPGVFFTNPTGGFNYGFGTVMVNNDHATSETVDLCVDLLGDISSTGTFDIYGGVEIGMSSNLYNAWVAGGSLGTNVVSNQPNLITITNSSHACVENITLTPGCNEKVGLRFNYNGLTFPPTPMQYNYQLSQSKNDEDGNIVYGSNTIYVADVPTEAPNQASLKPRGIEQTLESEVVLNVLPNPASSELYVHTNSSMNLINIFSLDGKMVMQKEPINPNKETLDIAYLAKGVYIIEVHFGNNIERRKIVKE